MARLLSLSPFGRQFYLAATNLAKLHCGEHHRHIIQPRICEWEASEYSFNIRHLREQDSAHLYWIYQGLLCER
jgi:hypothetical protein